MRALTLAKTLVPGLALLLAGCIVVFPTPHPNDDRPRTLKRVAFSGKKQRIEFFASVHADCTSSGIPVVKLTEAPAHGAVSFVEENDYPNYPKDNQRYDCNERKVPGTTAYYTSVAAFSGSDKFEMKVVYPQGNAHEITVAVTVDSPVETKPGVGAKPGVGNSSPK